MTRAEWDAKFKIVDGYVERNALALAVALFGDRPPPDPPKSVSITSSLDIKAFNDAAYMNIRGVGEEVALKQAVALRDWLTEYIDWRNK